MTTVLRLSDIRFHRDGVEILNGVSWTVRSGEHWALLGANGSGKTSLLKIITAYEWPHEGTVEVLGARFGQTDVRELRKRVGWVTSALTQWIPPFATALEVAVSGIEASIGLFRDFGAEETELARASLHQMGIAGLADRPYGVLSQGERQRALIARALTARPGLLILDEPCGGLDPAARELFLSDLDGLVRSPEAPTILFVTHHVEEIPPLVTHAHLLGSGRTLAKGPASEVINNATMSRAFSTPCSVEHDGGRFRLRIELRSLRSRADANHPLGQ